MMISLKEKRTMWIFKYEFQGDVHMSVLIMFILKVIALQM